MKVIFHNNQLCIRGSTVALEDYARYNEEILGNESIICYPATGGNDPGVVARIQNRFKTIAHHGSDDFQKIVDKEHADYSYFIRFGTREFLPTNCRTGVHSVFRQYEPHGDTYAYVSEWVAATMARAHGVESLPWVPHMTNLPAPTEDYREKLGIGKDKTIIGRIGGSDSFNLGFVYHAIANVLAERNDIVFVFVNTDKWINHPNVLFVPGITDVQEKSNMINTWDAMIHARSDGESFGIAIAEALSFNKPVLTWEGGGDQHHVKMLAGSGLVYSQTNIVEKINNIRDYIGTEDYTKRVEQFRPEPVMKQFKDIFFKG